MYFIRSLFISELSSSLTQTHAWEKRDKSGARDWHAHTTMYKIDNQQGPTISTGNSTQYSVITYMRKESEKEWIYVCVCVCVYKTKSLCYIPKPMQHCKSTILQINLKKPHVLEIYTQLGNISYTHIFFLPWQVL